MSDPFGLHLKEQLSKEELARLAPILTREKRMQHDAIFDAIWPIVQSAITQAVDESQQKLAAIQRKCDQVKIGASGVVMTVRQELATDILAIIEGRGE